jgi:branched-subunit amino acid aminotransferase/4-amino-4-deoxychorismate lyase
MAPSAEPTPPTAAATAEAAAVRALALTNYGHFTTLRVEGGRVRGLSRHLERLTRDCRTVFGAELDPDEVRARIRAVCAGTTDPVLVRVTVVDPGLGLAEPSRTAEPRLLLTTRPVPPEEVPPLRLRSTVFHRELPAVKHTGLFAALHARRAAQLAGFGDALFTGPSGLISEGPTWNIGFWDGRRLVWPEAEVLPGVTMALLREAPGQQTGHSVVPVSLDGLHGMRAAFVTSAGVGVRPVCAVDDVSFATNAPVLAELRRVHADIPGEPLDP